MVAFTARVQRLRSVVGPAASAASPLSAREHEVAQLVARVGVTNRRIAQTLVLSERTAENHVQHILTKLGLDNRTQIAAWVASHQRAGQIE
jgi:DNA-binding NarL/FixJ family response regulator